MFNRHKHVETNVRKQIDCKRETAVTAENWHIKDKSWRPGTLGLVIILFSE